jgi:hypothetical protein
MKAFKSVGVAVESALKFVPEIMPVLTETGKDAIGMVGDVAAAGKFYSSSLKEDARLDNEKSTKVNELERVKLIIHTLDADQTLAQVQATLASGSLSEQEKAEALAKLDAAIKSIQS